MKKCCACEKTQELNKFYVNKSAKDGYHPRCKKCMSYGKLCKRGRPEGTAKPKKEIQKTSKYFGWEEIRLWNPTKQDYIETYEFLKKIGYKLDESIHEQFCEKYELKPKKGKPKKNHFSPNDCDLV